MATNDVQNSLFAAIDTIIGRRIEQLALDKTVVASVEQCVNSLTRQYRVQYKGGSMLAYAQSDESYTPNTSVYVSIPQNNFSEKKWILGRVSEITGDHAITEVSAALEDFQIIGENLVVAEPGKEFGLISEMHEDGRQVDVIELYNRTKSNNLINISQDKMLTYMTDTKAILLEASFRTNLSRKQQNDTDAQYGLAFTFVSESADSAYATYRDKFDALSPKINMEIEEGTLSLYSLDEAIQYLISLGKDYTLITTENKTLIKDNLPIAQSRITTLMAYYQDSELEYGLLSQYSQMLADMIASLNEDRADWYTHYGILFDSVPKTLIPKEVVYSLQSSDMIGQPFQFFVAEEQYNIFGIDTKHFKYIDKVIFYCYDFTPSTLISREEFEANRETWADIFVRDIELYCLQELSAVNGDYRLKMKFPQGQIFEDPGVEEDGTYAYQQLNIGTEFFYKNDLLTNGIKYYWFIKDGRVTSASNSNYHIRGGVGWRYFDKPENADSLIISAAANTAYENIYKCVVVYQETIVLKSEFKIYNNANRRTIIVESNLGTTFKFDNGTPVLTCKILDNIMHEAEPISVPEYYEGYNYRYVWMRQLQNGQTVAYEKSYSELLEEYNASPPSLKLALQSQLTEMEGISVDKNILTYPIYKIKANEYVTFDCHVYRSKNDDEKFLGTGSITLKNNLNATPSEYHIVIENGDQVFQYSESGVSPCNDRVQDPVKIKDLTCHFYDLNGLEVNSDLYTVTWKYPISNSLIIPPTSLRENPVNGLVQLYKEQTATFTIEEVYDYSCLDNQIACIVEYNGIKVEKETSFYFGKIGDNGTNGTDLVAKIEPINAPDNEPLTLIGVNGIYTGWNSGVLMGNPVLQFKVFNRNELIDENTYRGVGWRVAGANSSNVFKATTDTQASYLGVITPGGSGAKSNYIIRANADIVDNDVTQTVYAFYPICIIDYTDEHYRTSYEFSIDKDRTLKHILYNADGRNPMYNKNQGVFFNFSDNPGNYLVSWTAKGGADENEDFPAFDLFYDENTPSATVQSNPFIYIKPKDTYGGDCQNNYVEAKVYVQESYEKIHIATVKIPIYMSLNLYGLASLNGWDGNTIEINEEGGYIMAPQIGAGVKNQDNTFTGIVMGKATTYDSAEAQVGLLGFSSGRQSIFLDAETGNATFGLPQREDREDNAEGRIELRPGGISRIGGWNIGKHILYNTASSEAINDATSNETSSKVRDFGLLTRVINEQGETEYIGYGEEYAEAGYDKVTKDGVEYWKIKIGDKEHFIPKDIYAKGHEMAIDHDKQGILLSSKPAYISIKGRSWTEGDLGEETDRKIGLGDSLEIQLDPNQPSLFSIFGHKQLRDEDGNVVTDGDNPVWYRELLSGINAKGELMANTVQSSTGAGAGTSFGVGSVAAFGDKVNSYSYVGANFGSAPPGKPLESTTFFRIFSATDSVSDARGHVYLNGGRFGDNKNEYSRPLSIHGASVGLYSENRSDSVTEKTPGHRITVNPENAFIGHLDTEVKRVTEVGEDGQEVTKDVFTVYNTGNFLSLNDTDDSSKLYSKNNFETLVGRTQEWEESNSPWFNSINIPSSGNQTANKITKVSLGSIVNFAHDNEQSGGHILNYSTGSLQLNKVDDESGETKKTLQINDNNVLFGNSDLGLIDYNRTVWGTTGIIGVDKLLSNITDGAALEFDEAGTTLISEPRIGIYGQRGIDISSLPSSESGLGNPVRITSQSFVKGEDDTKVFSTSYLVLNPDASGDSSSAGMASQHGWISISGNARGELSSGSKRGVTIDPGIRTQYGIFNGSIDDTADKTHSNTSIYASKNINARDFNFHSSNSPAMTGSSSKSLKELLENHTHPFNKTIRVYINNSDATYNIPVSASTSDIVVTLKAEYDIVYDDGTTNRGPNLTSTSGSISLGTGLQSIKNVVVTAEVSGGGASVDSKYKDFVISGTSGPSKPSS